MILSFKTQISGKPTNFIEKIWSGFLKIDEDLYEDYLHPDGLPSQMPWPTSEYRDFAPKPHTIRKDEKNRWKPGIMIDFFINARTKNMFRFAPRIPVISTQEIQIYQRNDLPTGLHIGEKYIKTVTVRDMDFQLCFMIKVDEKWLTTEEIKILAINDGFYDADSFFEYFNEDFTGKIIHWTNLKY